MGIKTILSLVLTCAMSLTAVMPVQAMAAKPYVNHKAEYATSGVKIKGDAYYYEGMRIRIFQDMRADDSFENSFVDIGGTVDIRLTRNRSGVINKVERIPKAEANEILEDELGDISPSPTSNNEPAKDKVNKEDEYTDIQRCELADVPVSVQTIINTQCTGNGWYVIKTADRQYVYHNNLPRDYAFHIAGTHLNVRDIGRHKGIYVLLSLGNDFNFTLSYNSKSVAFTTTTEK